MSLSVKFIIKELTEDGLLKNPKNTWDENKFNIHGYDSKKEAYKAIDNENSYNDYIVLKQVSKTSE